MTRGEIIKIVQNFLIDEFEFEEELVQNEQDNMQETLQLDSLDYVDLFASIENEFGIKLNIEDFHKIETFSDLYNYIENRVEA